MLKPCLLDRIVNKTLTKQELNEIKDGFMCHLSLVSGTLENYAKKHIIKKVMEHYPEVIGVEYGDEYTKLKTGGIIEVLANSILCNKVNNAMVIRMVLSNMRGKDEEASEASKPQYIIVGWPTTTEGKETLPEPKVAGISDTGDW